MDEISGTVLIAFVVDKHGNMSDAKLKEGVHPSLNSEAFRVIQNILDTKWFPAIQNGVPVTIEYFLPVKFNLK